jgi:hypothetical protein
MKSPSNRAKSNLSIIVLIGTTWAIIAFFFSMFAYSPIPYQETPIWVGIANTILEETAFFASGWLCLINCFCRRLLSDRAIWFFLGIGLILQGIANLIFRYWEIVLQRDANVSLGDPFYVVSYIFLLLGIFRAINYRGLGLSLKQRLILVGVAVFAAWLAWMSISPSEVSSTAPDLSPASAIPVPAWVVSVENALAPIINFLNFAYVLADVILVILATGLILSFWGGRFSRTWLAIALGSFVLYIADIWYAVHAARINVEPVGLINALWTIGAIIFGIGAAIEYDTANRPPKSSARVAPNTRSRR